MPLCHIPSPGPRVLGACLGILLAPALLGAQALRADERAGFTTLSVKDGLVNMSVSGIVQDSKGFLWLSTQGGLLRYDGSGFKTFENEPFDETSISGDLIQTIFRDEGDVLWIGTYNGLNRFDTATGKNTRFRFDLTRPDSLSNDLVIAIARDARGRLWAGTINGLNRLDEATGRFVRYLHDDKDPTSLANNTVRALFKDSKGRLWIGTTGGGLASYDYEADHFDNYSPPASASLQAIAEDAEGQLWLGAWGLGLVRFQPSTGESQVYEVPDKRIYVLNTQAKDLVRVGTWGGGLHILDKASGTFSSYRNSKAVGSLPNDVVYSMLEDSSGELWIGTNGGGLARLGKAQRSLTAYIADAQDPRALPPGKIIASLVDSKRQLWVSVYSFGIHRLDPRTGSWIHYRHDDSKPRSLGDDICNSLYEDREGRLWAATNHGLSLFDSARGDFTTYRHIEGKADSPSSDIIYAVLEDPTGVFWIGTYLTGLDRWDRQAGTYTHYANDPANPASISDNLVNSLALDPAGRLWVGTNNGLNRLEKGGFRRYLYDPRDTKGLSSSSIQRLLVDSRGILWIPTRGGGLNRWYEDTDSFTHILRKDGLPNNIVSSVLEDRDSNLWIVTQTGIARLDRRTGVTKRVNLYEELDSKAFNWGSSKGPDGELYLASTGVVVRVDPSRYESNTHLPPVYITSFRAANEEKLLSPRGQAEAGGLVLKNWENSVEIGFAALDYRNPDFNLFAYRLEGFDRDWNYSGSRNYARYTNLPGGSYVFRVKASNSDGLWNEVGTVLPFSVAIPPLLSPLAIAAYLAVLLLSGYGLAKLRSNRILASKVEALTATEAALVAAGHESRRLAEEAEGANRAKSEFIATVSHEIRTPMNGVLGMAELLSRTELDLQQRDYVETITKSGSTLLELINGVLDFSKLEADRVILEALPFDLAALARDIMKSLEGQASTKGLRLELSLDEAIPPLVTGDPLRLRQVLANLLGNAVKFTDRGRVGLRIAVEGDLSFQVSDTGIGIAADKLEGLFRPFSQADISMARRYGGTGLGLSISKRYVELMGGSLGVESVLGQGSTFSFAIPLFPALPAPAPAPVEEPQTGLASLAGLRILVVDDDPVNRKVAAGFLSGLGIECVLAESGHAALAELARSDFSLVLLDCMMPGMDGYETARSIRSPASGARMPGIPIIAMTARASEEDRQRCLDAGMSAYLTKPLTQASLARTIQKGLVPEDRVVFDEAGFRGRYEGAPELAAEILGLFLDQTGTLLATARQDGAEGRLAELADAAHRLRGSSGAIGACRLSERAGILEEACRAASPGQAEILAQTEACLREHEALLAVLGPLHARYLSQVEVSRTQGA